MPAPAPIDTVLFDLHGTLLDTGDAASWLAAACVLAGRAVPPVPAADLAAFLGTLWDRARSVDPAARRDLSAAAHRRVFDALVAAAPGVDPVLGDALYRTLVRPWRAYRDAAPTLAALRASGIATVALSNMGIDVRDVLHREDLLRHLDAVVLSGDVGLVKPDPRLFQVALDAVGATGARTLMVGDTPGEDGGGTVLGIRTLILPRTRGPVHGLWHVTALVAAAGRG